MLFAVSESMRSHQPVPQAKSTASSSVSAPSRVGEKCVTYRLSASARLAGVATAIVVVIFFAFYVLVYLPRGAVQ